MPALLDMKDRHCRYPLDDGQFCGKRRRALQANEKCRSPYCAEHHKLCHHGRGRSWEALAGMIHASERTVIVRCVPVEVERAIDEAIR